MPTPIETVTAFCAEWGKGRAALRASVDRYFTPTTVWENVGFATTTGPADALGLLDGFEASAGVTHIAVDMLAIAAAGNVVLTERIDHLLAEDGSERLALRLMGVFEVVDGRIARWRDYFDTAALGAGKEG